MKTPSDLTDPALTDPVVRPREWTVPAPLRDWAAESQPGWAWRLPRGPDCARRARTVLGVALAELGVGQDLAADAQLMISELATNAYQHAGDHRPHELWAYLAGTDGAAELRCAVFDRLAGATLPGYSWTSGDYGRGLNIVRELSAGRWGLRHARSRLGRRGHGKIVWFAVPGALPEAAAARLRGSRPVR